MGPLLVIIPLNFAAILWAVMHEIVNKNGVGMSPILCDHTLCEHASHEKYYEHSYLVSLFFAETFLLTIIFQIFFYTCIDSITRSTKGSTLNFVSFPTGYGESIIFVALPLAFDKLKGISTSLFIVSLFISNSLSYRLLT